MHDDRLAVLGVRVYCTDHWFGMTLALALLGRVVWAGKRCTVTVYCRPVAESQDQMR